MVSEFFTGLRGRNFFDWVGGGGTLKKLILFEASCLFFTMVNDDDKRISSQVDLKMSTVKPLYADWAINTHNLIPQCPELN